MFQYLKRNEKLEKPVSSLRQTEILKALSLLVVLERALSHLHITAKRCIVKGDLFFSFPPPCLDLISARVALHESQFTIIHPST